MKELVNPYTFQVMFDPDDSGIQVTSAGCDYTVRCEHDLEQPKGMPVVLTAQQENDLKDICKDAILPQMRAKEGIPEPD